MRLIKPSYEILTPINGMEILSFLEKAGKTCYKSESTITDESCVRFCKNILNRNHESVIEHINISVKFITDRGVLAELTRHRLASYSVESTRYVSYKQKGLTFIIPPWCDINPGDYEYNQPLNTKDINSIKWVKALWGAEFYYLDLITSGWQPQQARSVLPNSLKTEIVTTVNLREWRHIFKLRTASTAHIQIQEIMKPLLSELKTKIPIIFDDILSC
jgi:thymidylate synthase (FAD)